MLSKLNEQELKLELVWWVCCAEREETLFSIFESVIIMRYLDEWADILFTFNNLFIGIMQLVSRMRLPIRLGLEIIIC